MDKNNKKKSDVLNLLYESITIGTLAFGVFNKKSKERLINIYKNLNVKYNSIYNNFKKTNNINSNNNFNFKSVVSNITENSDISKDFQTRAELVNRIISLQKKIQDTVNIVEHTLEDVKLKSPFNYKLINTDASIFKDIFLPLKERTVEFTAKRKYYEEFIKNIKLYTETDLSNIYLYDNEKLSSIIKILKSKEIFLNNIKYNSIYNEFDFLTNSIDRFNTLFKEDNILSGGKNVQQLSSEIKALQDSIKYRKPLVIKEYYKNKVFADSLDPVILRKFKINSNSKNVSRQIYSEILYDLKTKSKINIDDILKQTTNNELNGFIRKELINKIKQVKHGSVDSRTFYNRYKGELSNFIKENVKSWQSLNRKDFDLFIDTVSSKLKDNKMIDDAFLTIKNNSHAFVFEFKINTKTQTDKYLKGNTFTYPFFFPKKGLLSLHPGQTPIIVSNPKQFVLSQVNSFEANIESIINKSYFKKLQDKDSNYIKVNKYVENLITRIYGVGGRGGIGEFRDIFYGSRASLDYINRNASITKGKVEDNINKAYSDLKKIAGKNHGSTHYIDLEFNSANSDIWQIGIVSVDNETNKISNKFIYNKSYKFSDYDKSVYSINNQGTISHQKIIGNLLKKNVQPDFVKTDADIVRQLAQVVKNGDTVVGKNIKFKMGNSFVGDKKVLSSLFNRTRNIAESNNLNGIFDESSSYLDFSAFSKLDDITQTVSMLNTTETLPKKINLFLNKVKKTDQVLYKKLLGIKENFLKVYDYETHGTMSHNALYDTLLGSILTTFYSETIKTKKKDGTIGIKSKDEFLKFMNGGYSKGFIRTLSGIYGNSSSTSSAHNIVQFYNINNILPFAYLNSDHLTKSYQMADTLGLYYNDTDLNFRELTSKLPVINKEFSEMSTLKKSEIAPKYLKDTIKNSIISARVGWLFSPLKHGKDGASIYNVNDESIFQRYNQVTPIENKVLKALANDKIQKGFIVEKNKLIGTDLNGAPILNDNNARMLITNVEKLGDNINIEYRVLGGIGIGSKFNIKHQTVVLAKPSKMKNLDLAAYPDFVKRENTQAVLSSFLGRIVDYFDSLSLEEKDDIILKLENTLKNEKIQLADGVQVPLNNLIKVQKNVLLNGQYSISFIDSGKLNSFKETKNIGSQILSSVGKIYNVIGLTNNSKYSQKLTSFEGKFNIPIDKKTKANIIASGFVNTLISESKKVESVKPFIDFLKGSLEYLSESKKDKFGARSKEYKEFKNFYDESLKTLSGVELSNTKIDKNIERFAKIFGHDELASLFNIGKYNEKLVPFIKTKESISKILQESSLQSKANKVQISPIFLDILSVSQGDGKSKLFNWFYEKYNTGLMQNVNISLIDRIYKGKVKPFGSSINQFINENKDAYNDFMNMMKYETVPNFNYSPVDITTNQPYIDSLTGKYKIESVSPRRVKNIDDKGLKFIQKLQTFLANKNNPGAYIRLPNNRNFQLLGDDLRLLTPKFNPSRQGMAILSEKTITLYNMLQSIEANTNQEDIIYSKYKSDYLSRNSTNLLKVNMDSVSGISAPSDSVIEYVNGKPLTRVEYNKYLSTYKGELLVNKNIINMKAFNNYIDTADISYIKEMSKYVVDYNSFIERTVGPRHGLWQEILKGSKGEFAKELKSFQKEFGGISFRKFAHGLANDKNVVELFKLNDINNVKAMYKSAVSKGLMGFTIINQKYPLSRFSIISPNIAFVRPYQYGVKGDKSVELQYRMNEIAEHYSKIDYDSDMVASLLVGGQDTKALEGWKSSFNYQFLDKIYGGDNPLIKIKGLSQSYDNILILGKDENTYRVFNFDKRAIERVQLDSKHLQADADKIYNLLRDNFNDKSISVEKLDTIEKAYARVARNASIKEQAPMTFNFVTTLNVRNQYASVFGKYNAQFTKYFNDNIIGQLVEDQIGQRRHFSDIGGFITKITQAKSYDDFLRMKEQIKTSENLKVLSRFNQKINTTGQEEYLTPFLEEASKKYNLNIKKLDNMDLIYLLNKEYESKGVKYLGKDSLRNLIYGKNNTLEDIISNDSPHPYIENFVKLFADYSNINDKPNKFKNFMNDSYNNIKKWIMNNDKDFNNLKSKSIFSKYGRGIIAGSAGLLLISEPNLGARPGTRRDDKMFDFSPNESIYDEEMNTPLVNFPRNVRLMNYNYTIPRQRYNLVLNSDQNRNVEGIEGKSYTFSNLTF